MRLVYMDEAGISNPKHEPWLVVSAVIVDADKKLVALQRQLDGIAQRHIPAEQRQDFIFHAKELFNGGGKVFKRNDPDWPLAKRLKIAAELAAIPKKLGLPLTFGLVERSRFPQTFDGSSIDAKEKTEGAHWTAFISCAIGVEMWMRKSSPNEVCLLIGEETHLKQRITGSINIYQDEKKLNLILGELTSEETKYYPLIKIVESPLFQSKAQSKALQLADFCAYVMKKRVMGDQRYDPLFFSFSDQIVSVDPKEVRPRKRA